MPLKLQVPYNGVLPFIQAKLAKPEDIFLINFGAWHRKRPDFPYNLDAYQVALSSLLKHYEV
jgi:hypothetical protein